MLCAALFRNRDGVIGNGAALGLGTWAVGYWGGIPALDLVPPEKYEEVAGYDGSVIAERTKGELAARCDMEEANHVALNLAHEIVTGERLMMRRPNSACLGVRSGANRSTTTRLTAIAVRMTGT